MSFEKTINAETVDFNESIKNAAVEYARNGYRVLRVKQCDKIPVEKSWTNDATNDPDEISKRFSAHDGNLGIAPDERFVVLDFDGKEGQKAFERLQKTLGDLPDTYITATPNKGLHAFYRVPVGVKIINKINIEPSLDIRGKGAYVVEAPSVGYCKSDNNLCCYYAYSGGKLPPVDELPMLPQEWVNFISRKSDDNKTSSQPIESPNNASRDFLIDRCRKFVAKKDPAVQGQCGQNQMWNVICAIFNGFDLSKSDGWDVLMEYNSRCCPPWSSEQDMKWINYAVDKAIETPKNRGFLAQKQRIRSDYEREYYNGIADDLIESIRNKASRNVEFDQFEEPDFNDSDDDIEKIAKWSKNVKLDEQKNTCSNVDAIVNIIDALPSNSIMATVSNSGADRPLMFMRALQIMQLIGGKTGCYAEVEKRGFRDVNGNIHRGDLKQIAPNLYTLLIAESGSGKSESKNIVDKYAEILGNFDSVSSTPETLAAERELFASNNIRLFDYDEYAYTLKSVVNDKTGYRYGIYKSDLMMYTAATKRNYTGFSSTKDMQKAGESHIVHYPFKSKFMTSTLKAYLGVLQSVCDYGMLFDGFQSRVQTVCLPRVRDNVHYATVDDYYTGETRESIDKSMLETLNIWKTKFVDTNSFDVAQNENVQTESNESFSTVDNRRRLLLNKEAIKAYHMIEKFCCERLYDMYDYAENGLGLACCNRYPDSVLKLAILFALNRCNPRSFDTLCIEKRDMKLAFDFIFRVSAPTDQNLFYQTTNNDGRLLDLTKKLGNAIAAVVEGKSGETISMRKLRNVYHQVVGRDFNVKYIETNEYIKSLLDVNCIEIVKNNDDKSFVKFVKTWEKYDHRVNYFEDDEFVKIEEFLNDGVEDKLDDYYVLENAKKSLSPVYGKSIDKQEALAVARKTNERMELERLRNEVKVLKKKNDEKDLEIIKLTTKPMNQSIFDNQRRPIESLDKSNDVDVEIDETDEEIIIDKTETDADVKNYEEYADPVLAGNNVKYYNDYCEVDFGDKKLDVKLAVDANADKYVIIGDKKKKIPSVCYEFLKRFINDNLEFSVDDARKYCQLQQSLLDDLINETNASVSRLGIELAIVDGWREEVVQILFDEEENYDEQPEITVHRATHGKRAA